MKEIQIEITGVTPLLCNRFTEEAQQSATSGNRVGSVGDRGTPREQAEKKLYLSNNGSGPMPILPGPNIFRCIMEGGRYFKVGRSKVTTQKSSLIPACVDFLDIEIPIQSKESWEVDSRPVRIPATGGRILAHRPLFNDWKMSFIVHLDTELLGVKLFREIVDAAGRRIGLGDFRPDCKGPFGRFKVTNWKEEDLNKR